MALVKNPAMPLLAEPRRAVAVPFWVTRKAVPLFVAVVRLVLAVPALLAAPRISALPAARPRCSQGSKPAPRRRRLRCVSEPRGA